MAKLGNTPKYSAISRYTTVVAFAVLGVFMGALLINMAMPNTSLAPVVDHHPLEGVKVAAPVKLSIPSIGLETDFTGPLGLNEDRTVAMPDSYEAVGWYQYGPKPGELGPSVIFGHVDSYQGPAVFFDLKEVKPGDEILIDREDGSQARFIVTELENRRQSSFPTEAVYGDIDHAGLRLITCSGFYDHSQLVYSHNLIVYAKLAE